jgi:AbiV family abortive infection protein
VSRPASRGKPKPFDGEATTVDLANAMRAARLNALDLFETAELLHSLKRFPHSLAFSTLAIEEAGKIAILQRVLLGQESAKEAWKDYRLHRIKSGVLNPAIQARIRVYFPEIPPEKAKELAELGSSPDQLEEAKQQAIYSDCLNVDGEFVCHVPRLTEWRQLAGERLAEAQAIVLALRDRSPEELEVWKSHAQQARSEGRSLRSGIKSAIADLIERGFVRPGAFDSLLSDLQADEDAEAEPSESRP